MRPSEWMTLSQVAAHLGMHPGTIRSWSDRGLLPVHRTQGGHRRFLRHEVESWLEMQRAQLPPEGRVLVQSALRATRFQIQEGRLQQEGWYAKLDEAAREQYRQGGRVLLEGLMTALTADEETLIAQADRFGFEYASRGHRYGLDVVEATTAFLFFHGQLLEAMLQNYENAAARSQARWGELFRKLNTFTDQILIALLETYGAFAATRPEADGTIPGG
jgi:excisionase family DNA binding protein